MPPNLLDSHLSENDSRTPDSRQGQGTALGKEAENLVYTSCVYIHKICVYIHKICVYIHKILCIHTQEMCRHLVYTPPCLVVDLVLGERRKAEGRRELVAG